MNVCSKIREQFGALFTCKQMQERIRIRTPFTYPDGDLVDIFYEEKAGRIRISDLGGTVDWLQMQYPSYKGKFKRWEPIKDVCHLHRVEFSQGELFADIAPGEELGLRLTQLVQTCIQASDLWLTFRGRSSSTFFDEVADFLDLKEIEYVPNEKWYGASKLEYTIDFHTKSEGKSALLNVLANANRSSTKSRVEHLYTCCDDIGKRADGQRVRLFTLIEDSNENLKQEEENLLKSVCDIAYWSNRNILVDLLAS